MDKLADEILRRRMHGLFVSRKCGELEQLAHELLGMHCWFSRNVAFSALIRGADLTGWKTRLTKTWIHHALHGVVYEDLPLLLAIHAEKDKQWLETDKHIGEIAERVISLMEDGVFSRAEMRKIFAYDLDEDTINWVFSGWGGIFVPLASCGRVAFRDMTSRDFDLISAEPALTAAEALPEVLRRYFTAYGPASLADAAWFLGLWKEKKKLLNDVDLSEYAQLTRGRTTLYYVESGADMAEIPALTLLSGFDPLIVSYEDRSAILPAEYKKAVVNRAGVCLPSIAVDGKIAGLWNIKKNAPVVEFFTDQPKRVLDDAYDLVDNICRRTRGIV